MAAKAWTPAFSVRTVGVQALAAERILFAMKNVPPRLPKRLIY